ncbi:3-hydroxyacyl-CoA dehydrogenase/enoyl-CoA hydratase family protein [Thermoplasma sp.]|uniref:3-hydroxyacyl-CoA dehydrogenase/enoyl-CoA hydratase family protein n=1 Tax=Thermoplasma sp. TaxID=1973142 RepID=UPI0012885A5C|nr:3-hydroxyacyl-CoA dehydrogenase/enoyl-CoA hydratase family protein [Thermoplasma sp.]KAA8922421.1 MAG: 3-hydroxyacyl-CoA dehydrogenase/enoyl-CoA hydratase family protein [Thermoplasma sp.]
MNIKEVCVIGSGEMGHGIAEVFAINGFNVRLEDISDDILAKALKNISESLSKLEQKDSLSGQKASDVLARIKTFTEIGKAVNGSDLVIEAVPEIEDLKKKVFSEVEKYADDSTILASNTSNIRITDIANVLRRKDRFAGLHFFNPPVILKLVEVIKGEDTSEATAKTLIDIVKMIGKYPIMVNRDVPGFVVNRVNAPVTLLFCLYAGNGIASPEEIDAYVKNLGYPMGPFELSDYVGIDVAMHSIEYFARTVDPDYAKCTLFGDMVRRGKLGMKTGSGFYDWSRGRPKIDTSKTTDKISADEIYAVEINEATKLVEMGVSTPEDIETGVRYGLNRKMGPITEAENMTNEKVLRTLEDLKKKFNNNVFDPSDSIKNGRMHEILHINKGYSGMVTSKQYRNIIVENLGNYISRIKLNRPKYNTISDDLLDDLEDAIRTLWTDDNTRAIIITGEGNVLSAGADLKQFTMTSYQFAESSRKGERIFEMLSEIPKLTVVVMKGYALGGALELSLACDIRIASPEVKIGFPEVTLGLVPGWGGSQRLARIIGYGRALEFTLTGKRITGREAYDIGLVNEVADDPDIYAVEFASNVLKTSAPISIALIKRLINKGTQVPRDIGLDMEAFAAGIAFSTEDLREGIDAFFEKRKPQFRGR